MHKQKNQPEYTDFIVTTSTEEAEPNRKSSHEQTKYPRTDSRWNLHYESHTCTSTEVSLDGAEGKSIKTRTSGGPRARESLGFPFAPARPPQRFWVPRGPPDASQGRKT
jgi:hypothetical protein